MALQKVIHYYEYNDPGAVSGVKASGRYSLPVQDSPVYDNSASGVTGNQEYIKIGNEATSKMATTVHQKR